MIGQTIAQYTIREKLGEGGMGVVYKAQDRKLDRLVALKFLPHQLTVTDEDRERFVQEARAAATLNHPNVCTVYEIRDEGEHQFIAMEFVEGKTLRAAAREGGMPLAEVIDIALQIAEALQEAHGRGIVHRDIKSENIMVTSRGRVKVMDFGLAKLRGSMRLTKSSSTIGTLGYMAPEQIQGGEVDARSDLFSFGVVLYELLTGRLPFRGEHDAAMMYSILNEEPQPLEEFISSAPSELLHVLRRALEKDPADRYQSAEDMAIDLRRLKKDTGRVSRADITRPSPGVVPQSEKRSKARAHLPNAVKVGGGAAVAAVLMVLVWAVFLRDTTSEETASAAERQMIVVLPFQNLGNQEMDYFADGMTEEITSRLAGLSGLGVIGRSSAIQYKKTTKSVKDVGGELGVSYVLEGTVRWEKSPDGETRVRITPQLIRVSDATQVWSQPYEAVLSGVFSVQSDIASKVVDAMGVRLLASEQQSIEAVRRNNPEAYDLYLRGAGYNDRGYDRGDWATAIELLEKAVVLDPEFAQAYARLSRLHSDFYWFHFDRSKERLEKSLQAARKAIELDPLLADGYEAMGWYYYHGLLEYDLALAQFDEALRRRPQGAGVAFGMAAVYRRQGKFQQSIEVFEKGTRIDPRDPTILFNTGETHLLMRNYTAAIGYFDRALVLSPDWKAPYQLKIDAIVRDAGDFGKAKEVLDVARRKQVSGMGSTALLLAYLARDYAQALTILREDPQSGSDTQFRFIPRALWRADILRYMGKSHEATAHYDSARIELELLLKEAPEDPRLHAALGRTLAGLGRRDAALMHARRAVEILPMSEEAYRGAYLVEFQAQTQAMVGQKDEAVNAVKALLAVPSQLSPAILRLDPAWDVLRDQAGFQALAAQP